MHRTFSIFVCTLASLFDCRFSCCLRVLLSYCCRHFVRVHRPPLLIRAHPLPVMLLMFARVSVCVPHPVALTVLFTRTPFLFLSCCLRRFVCARVFTCVHRPVVLIVLFARAPLLPCWSRCSRRFVCPQTPVALLAAFVSVLSR